MHFSRRFLLSVLVTAFASSGVSSSEKDEAIAKELSKLQGDWRAVSEETRTGKTADVRGTLVIYQKDHFSLGLGHGLISGTIVIDPTTTPKSCDLRYKDEGKEQALRCIYELEGDKLRLCFMTSDPTNRPGNFPGKKELKGNWILHEFKHEKNQK
jgi:uncharacterized protein (TIGR03067 family)